MSIICQFMTELKQPGTFGDISWLFLSAAEALWYKIELIGGVGG